MALTCPPNNVLLLSRRRENASDVPRLQVPPIDLRPGENRRDPSPREQLQHSAHTQAAVSMSHFEAAGADLSTEGSSNEDDFSSDISSRTCSSGTVLQSDCGSPLPGSVSPKAEYKSEGDGGEQCKVPARGAGSVTDGEDGRFEHLPRHTRHTCALWAKVRRAWRGSVVSFQLSSLRQPGPEFSGEVLREMSSSD